MGSVSPIGTITVRKDHACELCGQPIRMGTQCIAWTWFDDEFPPRTIRAHFLCERLRRDRYDLSEWWDDAPLMDCLDGDEAAALDAWCGSDPEWPALRAAWLARSEGDEDEEVARG